MSTSQTEGGARPPMPKIMFKLMNPLMALLLRSPLHGRVSKRLMLLTFTGRKSGKRYTTPVGYVRHGNEIDVFTHSPWWKNLRGGQPVTVRLEGKDYQGIGEPVEDVDTIRRMVRELIARDGKEMAQRMGFWVESEHPSAEELRQATKGTYFVRIRLQ